MNNEIKQRLAGAIVVIGLAVVVLPFLLDGQGFRGAENAVAGNSPSEEQTDQQWQELTLGPDGIVTAAVETESATEEGVSQPATTPAPDPAAVKSAAKPPVIAPEKSAPAPAPAPPPAVRVAAAIPPPAAPPPASSGPLKGWAVQVGSFSQKPNAERLKTRLDSAGFKTYVASSQTSAGTRHRVRVGPYPNRERAQQTQKEVDAQTGLKTALMKESGK